MNVKWTWCGGTRTGATIARRVGGSLRLQVSLSATRNTQQALSRGGIKRTRSRFERSQDMQGTDIQHLPAALHFVVLTRRSSPSKPLLSHCPRDPCPCRRRRRHPHQLPCSSPRPRLQNPGRRLPPQAPCPCRCCPFLLRFAPCTSPTTTFAATKVPPTACDTAGTASSRTATPVSAATSAAASPSDTRPVRSCAQARSVDLERWLAPH